MTWEKEVTRAKKAPILQQDLGVPLDLALQSHDNQDSVFPPGTVGEIIIGVIWMGH